MTEGPDAQGPIQDNTQARGSIWSLKPWWCQPWSIVLTGAGVIAGSWLLLHRWWISAPTTLAVLVWWWLFLVVAPTLYRQTGRLD